MTCSLNHMSFGVSKSRSYKSFRLFSYFYKFSRRNLCTHRTHTHTLPCVHTNTKFKTIVLEIDSPFVFCWMFKQLNSSWWNKQVIFHLNWSGWRNPSNGEEKLNKPSEMTIYRCQFKTWYLLFVSLYI